MKTCHGAIIAAMLAMPAAAPAWAQVSPGLLTGDMAGVVPDARPEVAGLLDAPLSPDGATLRPMLGDRLTVLNFWATWCAPCIHEMPTLEALAADPPAPGVAVIAAATGRNPPSRIAQIWEERGLGALGDLRDPQGVLGRGAGVAGLPATLILDAQGAEIARLTGPADWNAPEVRALIAALAAANAQVFTGS